MKDSKDQNDRLLKIILISWLIGLFIIIGLVTWGTVTVSRINSNYTDLANRPPEVVRTIETQLQPIYTTIEGKQGPQGESGKDSMSTTTIIHTETQIPGPKGDTGKSGKPGIDARPIELAFNPTLNTWYQRYVGDDSWVPVVILGVQ